MMDTPKLRKVAPVSQKELREAMQASAVLVALKADGTVRFAEWTGDIAFTIKYVDTGNMLVMTRVGKFETDLPALLKDHLENDGEPYLINANGARGKWTEAKTFTIGRSKLKLQLVAMLAD